MSCLHYQSMDPSRERPYYDGQYNSYSSYTPRTQTPDTYRDVLRIAGYYSSWRMAEHQGNFETPTAGDTYSDIRSQTGRSTYKQETLLHGDQIAIDKMQTKMKFLENSNIVMQTRNQNLITENKALASQLKEEQTEIKKLEKMIASLREELDNEKLKVEQIKEQAEQASKKNASMLKASGTSTTNIVSRIDRGIQIWAVCMGCQRKLESCEKQPPTVTITKSELEVLEKDMQTLRDTIIAREEAWDKAMEREQNYRQQLTRLTTETITARHLSETRHEEVKTMSNVLSEKESELKCLQKENLYLDKLITKLYSCCLREKEVFKATIANEMNEKDIKFVEELVRRMTNAKSKQKPKSKSACFERSMHSGVHQIISPRDKSARTMRDQTSSRDSKR
ncbi:uncharacterized protein LOC100876679 isoform X2 [Megachile rotundata]|uniref:uncharacterized protein LOC100876679 isoform X2 n=1 Tax=Megachile rotundata TaxID=143995 RepID=UPI003FCFAB33